MKRIRLAPRNGFTLAEILVTLAIIAILVAVLLPVVTGQLRKGDISRTTSDLASTRIGIETFMADVRRVPGDLTSMISVINASSTDINDAIYPAGLIARWNGPYLDKTLSAASNIPTGFGGVILNDLDTLTQNGVLWAVVEVDSLTTDEMDDVDFAIDAATNSSTGRVRRTATQLRYLAVPIQ